MSLIEGVPMTRQTDITTRDNGCWLCPVVAIYIYYKLDRLHDMCSPDFILGLLEELYPVDQPEEAVEVIEKLIGFWPDPVTFSDDSSTSFGTHVDYKGTTSENSYGTRGVAVEWISHLQTTIRNGDLVLLLVERLEQKDKGNTHYLLCIGCQVLKNRSRRSGNSYSYRLLVKDPMEGDVVLAARLWEDQHAELITWRTGGGVLDRYKILEATHLHGMGMKIHEKLQESH